MKRLGDLCNAATRAACCQPVAATPSRLGLAYRRTAVHGLVAHATSAFPQRAKVDSVSQLL